MSGADGRLTLKFRKKQSGKTYMAEQYYKLPLQVLPPFYQDKDGCAFLYLLNPSGGILQHDILTTDILVEEDAKALITTPSNNKLYRMDDGHAKLINNLRVLSGGELEYLPEHNVPFAKSKTYQETTIHLEESSKLIAFDMVTSGRLARGETFHYDLYSTKMKIYINGKLKVYEYGNLMPNEKPLSKCGVLEDYGINASIYFYKKDLGEEIYSDINKVISDNSNVIGGVTFVEEGLGIIRLLGNGVPDMQEVMSECWDILRVNMLGKNKVRIRKY